MLTRRYLYTSKCLEKCPSFSELIKTFTELIEREIAAESRTLDYHAGKWGAIFLEVNNGTNDDLVVLL